MVPAKHLPDPAPLQCVFIVDSQHYTTAFHFVTLHVTNRKLDLSVASLGWRGRSLDKHRAAYLYPPEELMLPKVSCAPTA